MTDQVNDSDGVDLDMEERDEIIRAQINEAILQEDRELYSKMATFSSCAVDEDDGVVFVS